MCLAARRGDTLLKEFRDFALRGNVVDLAVGIIIGTAFGAIVKSLVDDVLMPIIGVMVKVDFSELKYVLQAAQTTAGGEELPEVAIRYGAFINFIITFMIVAFAMFMVVKAMNNVLKKKAEAPPAPPEPSAQEKLLTEIRDLLAKGR
jgi:large conductance mechanosensitive channel